MEVQGRKLEILSAIVEIFIDTRQPVGSIAVCRFLGYSSSPATVRNEMATLVLMGFLEQPHVSAGRVPSAAGIRTYVEAAMPRKLLLEHEKNVIDGVLAERIGDFESVVREMAKTLALVTGCMVVFAAPSNIGARVNSIKFVQISDRSAMLILITSTGMVQNRLFTCDFTINEKILGIFSEAIGEKFKNKVLVSLLPETVGAVFDYENMNFFIAPAFDAAIKAVRQAHLPQAGLEGQRNLFMISPEQENALEIFEFLNNEELVSKFLLSGGKETRIFIGEEIGIPVLEKCGIVKGSYKIGGRYGGVAAVGSVYHDYADTIAKLEYVTHAAENIFSKIMNI